MDRRSFLIASSALLSCAVLPAWASATSPRLLILIELRGGNDGLNTVIPIDDGAYFDLRPRLAIKPDAVARFESAPALHPSLAPLEPLWRDRQMAILQGVGYPAAQSVALPVDRNLGYRVRQPTVSANWMADSHRR